MKHAALFALLVLAAGASASAQHAPLPSALCAGWQGQSVCERLHEDPQIRVLRCTFAPGVGHEMHYHPPHFGYALAGETTMQVTTAAGVEDRPVRAGGSFAVDAETRHRALNVGAETAAYLVVEKKYADTRAAQAVAPGLCAR